jgi:hypothetical protein
LVPKEGLGPSHTHVRQILSSLLLNISGTRGDEGEKNFYYKRLVNRRFRAFIFPIFSYKI